jgi:glycerol uptake facilitator protein
MNEYLAEFIGTAILILFGNGVVAGMVLKKTKGHGDGWLTITIGWGLAVYLAVAVTGRYSGAHINPAVTVGLVAAGKFAMAKAGKYILAQMLGAAFGAFLVFLMYKDHYAVTEDADAKLATFSTGPAIRNTVSNLISEIIGTFILVFVIFYLLPACFECNNLHDVKFGLGAIGALPVALLVTGIGISLGGLTGYAINPARDLGPRIMHFILPIPGKRDSDWSYAWIPVVGPLIGAVLAAMALKACGI